MRSSPFRPVLSLIGLLFILSCNSGPAPEDLNYLQGYWEIRKVAFEDGAEKAYAVNTTIEYFQWDGKTGYRKKVQPTLEGRYLTSDDALPMEVNWREESLFLEFSGGDSRWEEEVLLLDTLNLTTRHSNGIIYSYTRHEPFSLKETNVE
ncbi:hypothetical protein [Robiginitalea aurantiaca]|uniref:Lipocalin-like domain-containing protein n=1 Tax=Robiginitalea aurantiaca TaxID=3056915 RepID=A0ABT7WGK9_9FLAO|nr:hypothetical protein [Robiginitalea aurantiaca]MDM9632056.1 hypothetical protein [Robiginitalea aurantiaca]